MTVHTYDIVASDVAALIGHLGSIGTTTSPNSTTVGVWITQCCSDVNALLRAKGMDPAVYISTAPLAADLEMYHSIRSHIIEGVAAKWYAANQAGGSPYLSLATEYGERYDAWRKELKEDPANTTGATRGQAGWTNVSADNLRDSSWNRTTGYR